MGDASKHGNRAAKNNTLSYKQYHYELLNNAAHLENSLWTVPIGILYSSAKELITQPYTQIALLKTEN